MSLNLVLQGADSSTRPSVPSKTHTVLLVLHRGPCSLKPNIPRGPRPASPNEPLILNCSPSAGVGRTAPSPCDVALMRKCGASGSVWFGAANAHEGAFGPAAHFV